MFRITKQEGQGDKVDFNTTVFTDRTEAKLSCFKIASEHSKEHKGGVIHTDSGLSIINYPDGSFTMFQVSGSEYLEPPIKGEI